MPTKLLEPISPNNILSSCVFIKPKNTLGVSGREISSTPFNIFLSKLKGSFFLSVKNNENSNISEDSAKLISSAVVFVAFNLAILLVAVYIFQLEISSLILAEKKLNNTETTMKQMHQQIQLITNHWVYCQQVLSC
jgi:hypothetical protein